jgi:hypothetical protein
VIEVIRNTESTPPARPGRTREFDATRTSNLHSDQASIHALRLIRKTRYSYHSELFLLTRYHGLCVVDANVGMLGDGENKEGRRDSADIRIPRTMEIHREDL